MAAAYASSAVGIFSTLYLNIHRTSFQEFVRQADQINLEKLVFTEEEFLKIDWIEEGHELEWKNKMYDVSSIEKTKSGFIIYGVHDGEEENIISFFNSWKRSNLPTASVKFQMQPQFCNALPSVQNEFFESELTRSFNDQCIYHSPEFKVVSPPPELHI